MRLLVSMIPAAALALLALAPAAALAHPRIVEVEGYYVVTNDGKVWVSEETNGKSDEGMYNLSPIPTLAGTTGLQVHDVCYGLYTDSEIDVWQPGDSFYGYIPWQHGISATGGEDSGAWETFWTTKLGVDFASISDLAVECASRSGTFVTADEFVIPPASDE